MDTVMSFPFTNDLNKSCSKPGERVRFVEQAIVRITFISERRGEIEFILESPSGTKSVVLDRRPADTNPASFVDWDLKSVEFWGENAIGEWKFIVMNDYSTTDATLVKLELELYGTEEKVKSLRNNF